MENFGSRRTQSFHQINCVNHCKNQLCFDFSFLRLILNFVGKHSSKLKIQIQPLHS